MKSALILVLALASQMTLAAQVINCPDIGDIAIDGDQAFVTYNEKLGFSDRYDTAYLVRVGAESVDYRVSKWGALLTVPKALLNGQATASIGVLQAETAYASVACSSK